MEKADDKGNMSEVIKALVVDDDVQTRVAMKAALEGAGYSVMTAGDGREALSLMGQFEPHVVITDILMPKMDGLELIRWVRRDLGLDVPILAMTCGREDYAEGVYLKSAKHIGADAILQKPFHIERLLNSIGALMQSPR